MVDPQFSSSAWRLSVCTPLHYHHSPVFASCCQQHRQWRRQCRAGDGPKALNLTLSIWV